MDNKKIILICSAGHSGSTLLDLVIGSHRKAFSLGEITHLPKNFALNTECMCGAAVKNCEFWQAVAHRLVTSSGIDLYSDPYKLDLGYINAQVVIDPSHQNKGYRLRNKLLLGLEYLLLRLGFGRCSFLARLLPRVRNNKQLFESVFLEAGVECVVDSSKSYIRAIECYLADPDRVRIIMLTRDGRGVFNSGLKHGFSREQSLNDWVMHYRRSLPLYDQYVSPRHLMQVKYEDLARNPAGMAAAICSFIGLEYDDGMLDFLGHEHHITNGNNMRFGSSEIKLEESWRAKLSPEELGYFQQHAGQLNERLGYVDA